MRLAECSGEMLSEENGGGALEGEAAAGVDEGQSATPEL